MQAEEISVIEQGELAHKNLEDIISAQYGVVANYFIIARLLTECQEMSWWKVLGDDSFNAFLGRPELGFKRSWAYELIKIYKLYVQRLGISAEDFVRIGPTKLLKMASVVERDKEKWLGDARVLSVSDLDIEIGAGSGETKISPLSSLPSVSPPPSACCACGAVESEHHHWPITRGAGADEGWWIPLCRVCHSEAHQHPKDWTWDNKRAWARSVWAYQPGGVMKKLMFEASRGWFGEYGYKRISFWRWLFMKLDGGYVIRHRWVK